MKMKNIAFFGVMASILSVAGAYAVDSTPTTIIATKSYVDTKDATKQDTITDLSTIRSGASAGATAVQPGDLATVATSGSYTDLTNKPSIPTSSNFVTNGTNALTLSDDATKAPSVTAVKGIKTTTQRTATTGTDAATNDKVPTELAVATALAAKQNTISDLQTIRSNASAGAGAATTIAGYGNIVTHNTSEFDASGAAATAKTEAIAAAATGAYNASGTYSDNTIGKALQGKQATISDLSTIRSNATAGKGAADTIATYGNIVTHSTSEFATSTQGGKADTAVQTIKKNGTAVTKTDGVVDISVPTKVSQLTNDSSFATTTQVSTAKSEAIAGAAGGTYSATGTYSDGTIGKALQGKQAALTTAQQNAVDSGITAAKVSTYDGYATTISGKVTANTAITAKTGNNLVSYDAKGLVTGGTTAGALATKSTIADADVATNAAIVYTKMKAPTATINGGTAACSTSAPCVLSYDGSSYSWTTFAY